MQVYTPKRVYNEAWPAQRRAHNIYPTFSPRHVALGSGHYRNVPPAWREPRRPVFGLPPNAVISPDKKLKDIPSVNLPVIEGSQILVTNLPRDVDQRDVEDLFVTTGRLRGAVLAHDKTGAFLGIAMVAFIEKEAASKAHKLYNGRIVDGRAPIRIDLVMDGSALAQARPRTLIDRLGPPPASGPADTRAIPAPNKSAPRAAPVPAQPVPSLAQRVAHPASQPRPRVRMKKGPKRVRKSLAQLDREMEDWLATTAAARKAA